MTNEYKKAMKMALQNAAEFIRGHGEEGGIDSDSFEDFSVSQYLRACKKIARELEIKADKINFLNTQNHDKKLFNNKPFGEQVNRDKNYGRD